jgi:mRNA interferase MazF
MDSTIKTTVSLPQVLWDQAESLAQQLSLSPNQLFEVALADFVKHHQTPALPRERNGQSQTVIHQGDVYWIQAEALNQSELGEHPHPYVVIQDDILNHSRINTVVVCALTTNRKQFNTPGNVLLEAGEANLPKQSAVVVSKVSTVEKTGLGEYIGTLSPERISQIWVGMRFLQLSFF